MNNEHILIMRFSAMGDVAMLVPVVYSLAKQYPDVRVTVLSRGFAKAFFNNLAPNVGFMAADLEKEYAGITDSMHCIVGCMPSISLLLPICMVSCVHIIYVRVSVSTDFV